MKPKEMFRIEHHEDHMAVIFIDMDGAETVLTVRIYPVKTDQNGPREVAIAWGNSLEGSDPVALAVATRNALIDYLPALV